MNNYRKPFSKKSYNRNDPRAMKKIKEILKDTTLKLIEHEDRFGKDITVYEKGKFLGHIEGEVKEVWRDVPFPFRDVQVPFRKFKFTNNTLFVMFNDSLNQHIVMTGKVLKTSSVRELVNKKSNGKLEPFFAVPLNKVLFNHLYVIAKRKQKLNEKMGNQ
jgi:hypothetical protein